MKHTFTFTSAKKLFPLLALVLLGTACNKKNDSQVTGTAYIEVTNASEGDSPFDFYVGSSKKNELPVPYKQTTTYFTVNTGQQVASIKTNATGNTLVGFDITPQPNVYYSIFYYGGVTTSYVDDLSIVAGKARVRFINLNKGIVSGLDYSVAGTPTPIVSNLNSAFGSSYLSVAPGATFTVYNTGTTTSILTIPTNTEAGHVYTIFLSGDIAADLQATVLLQK